jgi:hypothetical protein
MEFGGAHSGVTVAGPFAASGMKHVDVIYLIAAVRAH